MREKHDNTGKKSEGQKQKAKYNFQKIELVVRKHFLHSLIVTGKFKNKFIRLFAEDTKTNVFCLVFDTKDKYNLIAKNQRQKG